MKIKVYIYSISLVFLICENLLSQPLTWYKEYGNHYEYEYGRGVVQTADGGFMAFGDKGAYTSGFAVLLKTDSLGNEIWWKNYSPIDGNAMVFAFDKTTDGGYIITGSNWSSSPPIKIYLLKTDGDGNKLWDKSLVRENDWAGRSIKQISTGGFIITGGGFLAKTDDNGDTLWTRALDYSASSVCETSDTGFAITGASGGGRAFLLKTDSNGNELWIKYFGDYNDSHGAWSIQETFDSGFAIVGGASFSANEKYAFIIKTDKDGNQIFRKYYSIDKSYGRHLIQLPDSGYAITGYNDPPAIYVLRLDVY